MKVERVVLDTNVLISAAIVPEGKARACLDQVLRHGKLINTEALFEELETRLAKPKFRKYLSEQDRLDYLQFIRLASEWVTISGLVLGVRDPDDDKVLETAIAGRAEVLVTGDGDLLSLRPVGEMSSALTPMEGTCKGVAILKPAEFLRLCC